MAAVSRPGPRSKKPSGAPPRTGTRTSILSSGAVDGGTAPRAAPGSPSCQMSQQLSGCTTKARFSLIREPVGDDENAGCCQQRIDDVRQSVVATVEALVGEQPSIGVLDNAANGAQPGSVWFAPLADQRQDALGRAQPAVLGAVIGGIGVEPRDRSADHQSAAQQGGKQHRVVHVGGGR